jgi:replicative DNA helicase
VSNSLPHDLELERQVLGALLVRPDLIIPVSSILYVEDFYLESHRIIYDVITTMSAAGSSVDALSAIQYLKDRQLLAKVGDAPYIMEMVEQAVYTTNAPVFARKLKSLSVRRALILTVRDIEQEAVDPQEDENRFLKSVSDRVLKITNVTSAEGPVSAREIRNDFVDYIANLLKTKGGISGLRTGYTEFDDMTSGLKGGELIVLAARPGQGKTTLAMNMAANVSTQMGQNALVFSLEMGRFELLLRMLSGESRVHLEDLKKGRFPPNRSQAIQAAIDKITMAPLYLEDSGTVDIWDIMTLSRKIAVDLEQKNEKLGLVIVDYLQLVSDPEARKHGRQHEVASVSRSLKQLARVVDVPVIAISQMNRSVEQRKGDSAKPQLSDLRESGAIEQDADMVLFIHRESAGDMEKEENFENRGTAELIIAKHRTGPVGSIRLAYSPEINRFDNRMPSGAEDIR